jgi:hypothetical protein
VKLTAAQLSKLLDILERIDRNEIHPQLPDRIGRFLRQYGGARVRMDQLLAARGEGRRADGAVSGSTLGAIELHSILPPEVSLLGYPFGEVAETITLSEELGSLTNLVMWLKGPVANTAFNLLRECPGLRLSGDYRWTPPSRLTPGEALVASGGFAITWRDARCIKAVADDLTRPPHAIEYVLDYRIGPPSLKYFRCVCARKNGRGWQVLPAFTQPKTLDVAEVLPEAASEVRGTGLAALLIYREPWSAAWTIVRGMPIDAEDVLGHAITWADFRKELEATEVDGTTVRHIRESLRACGLNATTFAELNLTRRLLPISRDMLLWLRGYHEN